MKYILVLFAAVLFASSPVTLNAQPSESEDEIPIEKEPIALEPVAPVYPENARRVGLEGSVYLVMLLDEDGTVEKVEIDSSDHNWFTEAAIEAAKKARFTPAILQNGKPAKVWYAQKITFKLNDPQVSSGITSEGVGSITPEKDEWVEISQGPYALSDIQSLIIYPAEALRLRVEGKVIASILVSENGDVVKVDVERSDNTLLDQAAVDALFMAKFKPATQGDKPVKVWVTYPINFRLPADTNERKKD